MVQFSVLWTLGWGRAGKQATWGSGARRTAGLRQSLQGDAGARQVVLGRGGRSGHEWSTEAQASVGTSRMDGAEPAWTTPPLYPGKAGADAHNPSHSCPHPSSVSAPLCAPHEAEHSDSRDHTPSPHAPEPHPRLLSPASCRLLACSYCRQVSLGPGFRWGLSSERRQAGACRAGHYIR